MWNDWNINYGKYLKANGFGWLKDRKSLHQKPGLQMNFQDICMSILHCEYPKINNVTDRLFFKKEKAKGEKRIKINK